MVSEIYSNMVYFQTCFRKDALRHSKDLLKSWKNMAWLLVCSKAPKTSGAGIICLSRRLATVLFCFDMSPIICWIVIGIKQQLQIIRLLSDTLARHIWKIPEASRLMVAMSFTADAKLSWPQRSLRRIRSSLHVIWSSISHAPLVQTSSSFPGILMKSRATLTA